MSLKMGSNQISPIQIDNVINNQSNKNVTPTKSVQTIIPQQGIFSTNIQCTQGINGTVLIANIDASFLEYGKSYQVTAPRIRYIGNIHSNNGLFNILSIDTIWTASEDGEINFTLTGNSNTPLAGRITLSKTQIKVYFQNNGGANGGILGYYNNVDTITFSSVDPYDGLDQVTIEPIPSDYIIPEGTLTISAPGIINAASYASVSIPGMTTPTWNTATITSNTGKINYSINLPSGFKSTSQTFTSSTTLPSITGTIITPSEISQIAVNSYQWTKGSVIINAIPNSIIIYKKIIERTVNATELNEFLNTQSIIQSFTFIAHSNLSGTISASTITSIGSSAFYSCSKMTGINFENVSYIGSSAFNCCYLLNQVSLPKLEAVQGNTFYQCSGLSSISLPSATWLGTYCFGYCKNLTSVYLPNVSKFSGEYNFYSCSNLTTISVPELTYIYGSDFQSCYNLETISFPKLSMFGLYSSCFYRCSKLKSIYLMNSSMVYFSRYPSLNWKVFDSSPVTHSSYLGGTYASIYVPASLLAIYKADSGWAPISDRFVGV